MSKLGECHTLNVAKSSSGSAHFYSGKEKSCPFLATWGHETTKITGVCLGLLIKVGDITTFLFIMP